MAIFTAKIAVVVALLAISGVSTVVMSNFISDSGDSSQMSTGGFDKHSAFAEDGDVSDGSGEQGNDGDGWSDCPA